VKGEYVHHASISTSMGVKICAPLLEDAIAGCELLVVGTDDDIEELKEQEWLRADGRDHLKCQKLPQHYESRLLPLSSDSGSGSDRLPDSTTVAPMVAKTAVPVHAVTSIPTSHAMGCDRYDLPVPVGDTTQSSSRQPAAVVVARGDLNGIGMNSNDRYQKDPLNGSSDNLLLLSSRRKTNSYQEPAFRTIAQTFKKLPQQTTDGSGRVDHKAPMKKKKVKKSPRDSLGSISSNGAYWDDDDLSPKKKGTVAKYYKKRAYSEVGKVKNSNSTNCCSKKDGRVIGSVLEDGKRFKHKDQQSFSRKRRFATTTMEMETKDRMTSSSHQPRVLPQAAPPMRQPVVRHCKNNYNQESMGETDGDAGGSSGSGTEGGYAASASSNDNENLDSAKSSGSLVRTECFASPSNSPSLCSSGEGGSSDEEEENSFDSVRDGASRATDADSESPKTSAASTVSPLFKDHNNKNNFSETRPSDQVAPHREERSLLISRSHKRGVKPGRAGLDASTAFGNNSRGITKRSSPHQFRVYHHHHRSKTTGCNNHSNRRKSHSRGMLKDDRDYVNHNSFIQQKPTMSTKGSRIRHMERISSYHDESSFERKPSILQLGSDVMAHVLTFLEPPAILDVLTMPLSKEWRNCITNQQELWNVLCLLEPFKAKIKETAFEDSSGSGSSSEDSMSSEGSRNTGKVFSRKRQHHIKVGKHRILYTAFVRCMRYLARIKDDVIHGRTSNAAVRGSSSRNNSNSDGADILDERSRLETFLLRARGIEENRSVGTEEGDQDESINSQNGNMSPSGKNAHERLGNTENGINDSNESQEQILSSTKKRNQVPIFSADDGSNSYHQRHNRKKKQKRDKKAKKVRYGRSAITDKLLGPAPSGQVSHQNVDLPWSCALYSIVNWMVVFSDVEGIQIMCLKVLPFLLEDEQQRITAQRVGLTDVVLRGMVVFPNSIELHTASFHTIVLLARPLGGREGMLFHASVVNSVGIFSGDDSESPSMFSGGGAENGKNGVAVMLDSMRRFESDEGLQAMSCWSLVNIALVPSQKEVLVRLGGIEVTANAMMRHPRKAEVQFRALFALINLVIPTVPVGDEDRRREKEVDSIAEELDDMVGLITHLVILAMKNFCSSEAIMNRACLVLHNLSLTSYYHRTLLWTPNCYQMLEWCLANYRTDQVLQQSASGTLQRLQMTLSNDDNLRNRFTASIQTQEQLSLEEAHREALEMFTEQERLDRDQLEDEGR